MPIRVDTISLGNYSVRTQLSCFVLSLDWSIILLFW